MKATGLLDWDTALIAKALRLDEDNVKKYFTNGNCVAFLIKWRLSADIGYKIDPIDGLIDPQDNSKWKVRCITQASGVAFCQSSMIGTRRKFNKTEFLDKLNNVSGYILADIQKFPNMPYWQISVDNVWQWWNEEKLRSMSKISRNNILRLIEII